MYYPFNARPYDSSECARTLGSFTAFLLSAKQVDYSQNIQNLMGREEKLESRRTTRN